MFDISKIDSTFLNDSCYGGIADTLKKEHFVRLWQSSTSMEEFMERVGLINEALGPYSFITKKPNAHIRRANNFRKKGVPLKQLSWNEGAPKGPPRTWSDLAKLAEQLA